jgi:hypothetical protein
VSTAFVCHALHRAAFGRAAEQAEGGGGGGMGDNKEKDKETDCSTCLYVSPIYICVVPRAVSFISVLFPVPTYVLSRDGSRNSVSGSGYSRIRVPMFSFHNAVILPPG